MKPKIFAGNLKKDGAAIPKGAVPRAVTRRPTPGIVQDRIVVMINGGVLNSVYCSVPAEVVLVDYDVLRDEKGYSWKQCDKALEKAAKGLREVY